MLTPIYEESPRHAVGIYTIWANHHYITQEVGEAAAIHKAIDLWGRKRRKLATSNISVSVYTAGGEEIWRSL